MSRPISAAPPQVALGGSRNLPNSANALVGRVAAALTRGGRRLAVGCCIGADQAVLLAVINGTVPVGSVEIFAAFGPHGQGAAATAAVTAVAAAERAGAWVHRWAGGEPPVPVHARLAGRSREVVAASPAGIVVFMSSPVSRGSQFAAEMAAANGFPVIVFPIGFPPDATPQIGSGQWRQAAASGLWAGALRWWPAQQQLNA